MEEENIFVVECMGQRVLYSESELSRWISDGRIPPHTRVYYKNQVFSVQDIADLLKKSVEYSNVQVEPRSMSLVVDTPRSRKYQARKKASKGFFRLFRTIVGIAFFGAIALFIFENRQILQKKLGKLPLTIAIRVNEQSTDEQTNRRTNEQTNRRTDEQTNRRTNEQTNRRTNEQTNRRTDEQTNRRTDEQTNRRTDEQTNRRTDERSKNIEDSLFYSVFSDESDSTVEDSSDIVGGRSPKKNRFEYGDADVDLYDLNQPCFLQFNTFRRSTYLTNSSVVLATDIMLANDLSPNAAYGKSQQRHEQDYVFQNPALFKKYLIEKHKENTFYKSNDSGGEKVTVSSQTTAAKTKHDDQAFVYFFGDLAEKKICDKLARLYFNEKVSYRFISARKQSITILASNPSTQKWIVAEDKINVSFENVLKDELEDNLEVWIEPCVYYISEVILGEEFDSNLKKKHLATLKRYADYEQRRELRIQRNEERRENQQDRIAERNYRAWLGMQSIKEFNETSMRNNIDKHWFFVPFEPNKSDLERNSSSNKGKKRR